MTRDLLTTLEAAAELGVTPGRVRQLVKKGLLVSEGYTKNAHLFRRDVIEGYKTAPKPPKGRPRNP